MSFSDILGSAGVFLLLIAFVLNLRGKMKTTDTSYCLLNIAGAALCGISAYLIDFYPFVVLEAVWVLAAASILYKNVSRETIHRES